MVIFTIFLLIHSNLNLGFVGTTSTSTTRRPVASWSASRSSWKPGFARSTSSPSSRQSPSPPGKQSKPVCFVVKKKTLLMFPLQGSTQRPMELLATSFMTERWLFLFHLMTISASGFKLVFHPIPPGSRDDAAEKAEQLLRLLQHWGRTDDGQPKVVAKGLQLLKISKSSLRG